MPPNLQKPIIYLITSGETTAATTAATEEFSRVLGVVEAAVAAEVDLVQLREKNLTAGVLYELAVLAAKISRGSATRLLINDRADIARAASADGVHLTARSLEASVIRETFAKDFLIGVSTHSLAEARAACAQRASFAVFGPVFETVAKRSYGEPVGVQKLHEVVGSVAPFPILALGGIRLDNVSECVRAGASGVAAISLLNDAKTLATVVEQIRIKFSGSKR